MGVNRIRKLANARRRHEEIADVVVNGVQTCDLPELRDACGFFLVLSHVDAGVAGSSYEYVQLL
jgi:hypothetical protein